MVSLLILYFGLIEKNYVIKNMANYNLFTCGSTEI